MISGPVPPAGNATVAATHRRPPDPRLAVTDAAKGIALMVLAVSVFAAGDVFAKLLSARYPVPEVVWARFLGQLLIVLPIGLATGGVRNVLPRRWGPQVGRALLICVCAMVFFLALKHIPLADAYAISLVSPLFVTALSVPVLGERVGIRRWLAVMAGFAGVLVIIRPGFGTAHWAMGMALINALFWAVAQVMTPAVIRTETQMSMLVLTAAMGTVVLAPAMPFLWVMPDLPGLALMAASGLTGSLGHLLVFKAFVRTRASVLAPFAYVQLVWAAVFGFLVFGDFPDLPTLIGAGIVVASGLYVYHRESVIRRHTPAVGGGP